VKRFLIPTVSILGGWLIASFVYVALEIARLDIPGSMARTYSEYSAYRSVEILVFTGFFAWCLHRILARRFLPRQVDDRPFVERLPSWARQPSLVQLAIVWVVAVFTVVPYLLAIYMSWRYYVGHRDAESKVCPRCAERVKAAAIVCRHCGNELDVIARQPATLTQA
jgi:ribosomal protein L40E